MSPEQSMGEREIAVAAPVFVRRGGYPDAIRRPAVNAQSTPALLVKTCPSARSRSKSAGAAFRWTSHAP